MSLDASCKKRNGAEDVDVFYATNTAIAIIKGRLLFWKRHIDAGDSDDLEDLFNFSRSHRSSEELETVRELFESSASMRL